MKRTSKQESDFFSHFDGVEFVDIPTETWERHALSPDWILERYGIRVCKCGKTITDDRVTCPSCDKLLRGDAK